MSQPVDWFEEGRRWCERWMTSEPSAFRTYGSGSLRHLRALLRLTPTSAAQVAAEQGWRARMREISKLSNEELMTLIQRHRP